MELLIIAWLYVWGVIVTWALCRYSNIMEDGETQGWAEFLMAIAWPVVVPIFFTRRTIIGLRSA